MSEDLPYGWVDATLGQMGVWSSGGTPSRSNKAFYQGSIPWVKTGDLNHEAIYVANEHISDLALKKSSAKLFPKGTLLVAMYGATIGKTGILEIEAATNQACGALIKSESNEEIIPYVWKYLIAQQDNFKNMGQGGAQPNISQTLIKEYSIPLAPLPEQKRIVAKIDSLGAKSKRAKDHLNHIPKLVEKYKQAILEKAFSGELTKEWRLINGLGSAKFVSLNSVCNSISDGDHQAPPKAESGIPFITISAMNDGGIDLSKATRFVPATYYDGLKDIRRPRKGDLLYSVTGSYGIAAPVLDDTPFVFQRHIAILKPNLEKISREYLLYALISPQIKKQADAVATGTAQLTVPLNGLRNFNLLLPDTSEQFEIVAVLNSAFNWIDRLAIEATSARKLIDTLDKAILSKAFRGELVPQDPDDEPASVLLDRINSQRMNNATNSKRK